MVQAEKFGKVHLVLLGNYERRIPLQDPVRLGFYISGSTHALWDS